MLFAVEALERADEAVPNGGPRSASHRRDCGFSTYHARREIAHAWPAKGAATLVASSTA